MKSYPFTSQVSYDGEGLPRYDRAVDSEFLRAVFKQYFSDGVFYNPAGALQVTADTGMNVQVAPGACHIQGAMAIEDSPRVLAVQASGELDRIDTVVARLDLALGVRSIDLYVLKGTPSETPAAPALTRNNTVWELGLADLFIAKSTTEISQRRITDTRLDTARCGQVIAPAAPADLEPYFAQLQAAIAAHDAAAMEQIAELGRVIAEAGQTYNGIMPYTHTKNGTVHQLTGSGSNIKFTATAAFAEGDSVAVNGNTCTAKTISGDALWGGFWTEGAVVSCWLSETGDALNFSGAGLSEADKAKLVPGNLLDGVTIHSGGVTVAGSIPRKAAAAYTPGTSDQVLAAGQYLEGDQIIRGDQNLMPGNIRSGINIFGVIGNLEPAPNAAQVLANYTEVATKLVVGSYDITRHSNSRTGADYQTTSVSTSHTFGSVDASDFNYVDVVVYFNTSAGNFNPSNHSRTITVGGGSRSTGSNGEIAFNGIPTGKSAKLTIAATASHSGMQMAPNQNQSVTVQIKSIYLHN